MIPWAQVKANHHRREPRMRGDDPGQGIVTALNFM